MCIAKIQISLEILCISRVFLIQQYILYYRIFLSIRTNRPGRLKRVYTAILPTVYIQELRFLHSARHTLLVSISTKFHEDTRILDSFKVIERTRFCHRNGFKIQRQIKLKKYKSKSYSFCTLHFHPVSVTISTKFHEDILNVF